MSKRNFSIGITINLDNYENLRLDVGGEIENEQDAEELIGFLDRILSRLGRGTKETAQRVDSYRSRVFALQKAEGAPEQQAPPKREPPQEKAPAAAPPAAAAPKRIPEPPAPSAPAAAAISSGVAAKVAGTSSGCCGTRSASAAFIAS